MTERTVQEQVAINAVCAKHGIKFIAGDIRGQLLRVCLDPDADALTHIRQCRRVCERVRRRR